MLSPSVWNKIFRKSLWIDNSIFFREGVKDEDVVPAFKSLFYAKKVLVLKRAMYFYFSRPHSTTREFSADRMEGISVFAQEIDYFLRDKGMCERLKYPYAKYYEKEYMDRYDMAREGKCLSLFYK